MDSLLPLIADWFYFAGIEILIVAIALMMIIMQKIRFKNQLESYYQDSPISMLIIDINSGKLLLSNRNAMQLLGIRKVGRHYIFPSAFAQDSFLQSLQKISGKYFQHLEQEWAITDVFRSVVDFSGRKIRYKSKNCWLLYATAHQESSSDSERVKTSLRVARTALDSLSELIYIKDNSGEVVDTNRAFDKFWKDRYDEATVEFDGVLSGLRTQRWWTTDPQGRGCLLETTESKLISNDGDELGSLSISHDVTDWFKMQQDLRAEMEKRKGTEIALAQRDTILQSLLQSSPDAIALFNENRIYEACNQAFANYLGIDDHTILLGKRIEEVVLKQTYQDFIASDNKVMREGCSLRYRDQIKDENDQPRWFDVVKSPYQDPTSGANGVLIWARDVTDSCIAEMQLAEMNQELERLSFLDGLTQIANRRRFDEQLDIIWNLHKRQKMPLTVMLCDIDYFKNYNDNYGHQQGDSTLQKVAQSFQGVLTRASDCVARYGGEEFAFILPDTDRTSAQVLANNIHNAVKELQIEHEFSLVSDRITLSLGAISIEPSHKDTPEQIIELADQALYLAKKQGRNQTQYHEYSA
ncbi:diguanylate cyclase domain-containing protein [Vibrio sp. MA40-2]|uniref:GGDEF domain-containing protein n=1 Tax=Vibrio sp. MA40-2 TaxID=3391828 RepID=UPI0039A40B30